jgi:hypothetical protein
MIRGFTFTYCRKFKYRILRGRLNLKEGILDVLYVAVVFLDHPKNMSGWVKIPIFKEHRRVIESFGNWGTWTQNTKKMTKYL